MFEVVAQIILGKLLVRLITASPVASDLGGHW
jgi:hypothetical protein